MRFENTPNWLNLNYLSKAWPFVVVTVYAIGSILLNFVYVHQWGVSDFNISSIQCAGATLWLAVTLVLAFVLDMGVDRGIKWLEAVRISEAIVQRRPSRQRLLIVLLMLSNVLEAVCCERNNIRTALHSVSTVFLHWLRNHRILISVLLVYLICIVFCMMPMSLRTKPGEEPNKEVSVLARAVTFILKLGMFGLALWISFKTFELCYLYIPGRFGGGRPDPILLWVVPNSLPILHEVSGEAHECPKSELAIYRGLGLAHVGADYLVLNPENSSKYIIIAKDLVKRQELVARANPQMIDLFKGNKVFCLP